eukprot:snap_masked-scaffold_24-processed-gene-4.1-mRNA-1 protein AED:0.07 eAED:0.07 QI:0/-1/0/1/-1/1/1/0/327
MGIKGIYVGKEALKKRGILHLKIPIDRGIIIDWFNMEKIWHFAFFSVLQVDPVDFPVVLTEPPLNPKVNREKMTQIMFETFYISHLYIDLAAVLALYNSGKETGVVLDSGESVTNSIPIYKGFVLFHAIEKIDIGGRLINYSILKLLNEKGFSYLDYRNRDLLEEIKNNLCFISSNIEKEKKKNTFKSVFELPDGTKVDLGNIVFQAPEVLFNPYLMGYEKKGVHDIILTSIRKTDEKLKQSMLSNIILTGGNTLLKGFKERCELEITKINLKSENVRIFDNIMGVNSAVEGGIKFASSCWFLNSCISKEEYQKKGLSVLYKKDTAL